MRARKDLLVLCFAGFLVLFLDQGGIVFDNAGKHLLSENPLPQVIRHQAVRVGRIACAVLVSLVEGQKPAFFSLQACAELYLRIVHRKVNHAARELEQELLGAAIMLILIDRVIHVLFGELVFQLEGDHRQAIDENAQVQRQLGCVGGEVQLARDAEYVLGMQLRGGGVVHAGRHVEQHKAGRVDLYAPAQHIDDAALGDLIAHTGEKLRTLERLGFQLQLFHGVRLRVLQKAEEAHGVQGVFHVVVMAVPLLVMILLDKPLHNQAFEAGFFRIGERQGHSSFVGRLFNRSESSMYISRISEMPATFAAERTNLRWYSGMRKPVMTVHGLILT